MQRRSGLRADHSDSDHDGIGAQGKAAYGLRLPALPAEEIQKNLPGQLGSHGVQRGRAAIDVVVALDSGGQREVAQAKRVFRQQMEKLIASSPSHINCQDLPKLPKLP